MGFQIPNQSNFLPSPTTLGAITYCRKAKLSAGAFEKPGVFDAHNILSDTIWFLFAIFLEIFGLYALVINTGVDIKIGLFLAVVLILVDLILAYFYHFFSSGKTDVYRANVALAHNKGGEYISYDSSRIDQEKRKFQNLISQRSGVSYIFGALLFVLSAFKIFTYHQLVGGSWDPYLIGVIFSYIMVFVVHLRNTGYVLAYGTPGLGAKSRWTSDINAAKYGQASKAVSLQYTKEIGASYKKAFIKIAGDAVHYIDLDYLNTAVNIDKKFNNADTRALLNTVENGEEEITDATIEKITQYVKDEPKLRVFNLYSTCVLLDSDVKNLVNQFKEPESQANIAIACLDQQLRLVEKHKK